jgi:hypothetical protein
VCRRGHHDHPHTHEEVSTAKKKPLEPVLFA